MVEQSSSYSSGIEPRAGASRISTQLDSAFFCTNDDLAVGAAFEVPAAGAKSLAVWRLPVSRVRYWSGDGAASGQRAGRRVSAYGADWRWNVLLARMRGEAVTPKMLDLRFHYCHRADLLNWTNFEVRSHIFTSGTMDGCFSTSGVTMLPITVTRNSNRAPVFHAVKRCRPRMCPVGSLSTT